MMLTVVHFPARRPNQTLAARATTGVLGAKGWAGDAHWVGWCWCTRRLWQPAAARKGVPAKTGDTDAFVPFCVSHLRIDGPSG